MPISEPSILAGSLRNIHIDMYRDALDLIRRSNL